ncbi:hypothetical protein [uncultured Amnibacterium sp.]|uniref:hypothetical protein n=1 Tax=uncultured Amnibacterium sp. TaxID=1631851 RepID=UPI0035CC4EF2
MSTEKRLQNRVLRRELHSSKSTLAITLAVLAILALAWLGTESALAALGQPALLLSPDAMASGIRGLASVQAGILIAAGVVLALIGLLLIVAALSAGRRGRHVIGAGDSAAVVDDEVVGSALVRTAASTAGISPDRVVANVGRRSATVRITPISGNPIDRAAVQRDVQDAADGFALTPPIRTRVTIDKKGRVGG